MDEKKNFKKEESMIAVIFNVYDRFKHFQMMLHIFNFLLGRNKPRPLSYSTSTPKVGL